MAGTTCGADRPVRTIAVLNQKGGVGKTTTAVNLGAALAEAGRRVCLIDLDPQAHLTLHLGIDISHDAHSVYDLLIDPACEVTHCLVRVRECLDVIPAEVDLAGAEAELADHPDRQRLLRHKLADFTDSYDFIFVDCPPSLGLLALNALSMAGEVFVPMQAHFRALQGVGKLLQTVQLVCRSVNPALQVTAIVVCMHEPQTTLAREVVADLDEFFDAARSQEVPWKNCRVLRPPVRRNVKLAEAPSFGKSIFDYAPWCAGANDYRKLAELLVAETEQLPAAPEVVTLPASTRPQERVPVAAEPSPGISTAPDSIR